MKAPLLLLMLALATAPALAWADVSPSPVKLTIVPGKTEYLLGENVRVAVTVENTGTKDFIYTQCGDLSFTILATDAQGRKVRDPQEGMVMIFDVLSIPHGLKPGDKFSETFAINGRLQFTEPGVCALTITPSQWQKDWPAYPTATAEISFRMPDAAQSEQLVAAMEKPRMVPDPSGKLRPQYSDPKILCLPIYLEPLLRRARQGDQRALEGLNSIETPEATAALIELAAAATQPQQAQDLYFKLVNRMSNQGFGWSGSPEPHLAFVRRCWNDRLAPQARSLALEWLGNAKSEVVGWGAALFQTIGTPEDLPRLQAALDRALAPLDRPGWTQADLENARSQIGYLFGAIHGIYSRNPTAAPAAPKSDAELYVYFTALRAPRPPVPSEWKRLFDAHAAGGNGLIRQAALDSVPFPVPDNCWAEVAAGMMDPDSGVRAAALFASKRQIVIDPPGSPYLPPQLSRTMQLDADGQNGRFLP